MSMNFPVIFGGKLPVFRAHKRIFWHGMAGKPIFPSALSLFLRTPLAFLPVNQKSPLSLAGRGWPSKNRTLPLDSFMPFALSLSKSERE